MSGGLAPSKSTVYVSNLAFSLTNSDLHKIFSKYGSVVKVTVVKDKVTRKNKGVAFVQYLAKESANDCVSTLNGKVMFDRTVKCSIARDNGRASEFIKRKFYPDKSSCYECGEEGHLSYACPKNSLGSRTPPQPKKRKRRKDRDVDIEEADDEDEDESDNETLSAAIKCEQEKIAAMTHQQNFSNSSVKKLKIKKNSYFSDEEELSD